MLSHKPIWPSEHSIHFLHNWRCAGTTLNSILSSNFRDTYLKIGHPFTYFGWPYDYNNHPSPLLSLGQIKASGQSISPRQFIVGGHTFLGLEGFLPGKFDIWMNYRDPLPRLNSGILRFYNKKYTGQSGSSHLIDASKSFDSSDPDFPLFVDRLLCSSLKRESNGISRRLAAMSLCSDFNIRNDSNVETVECLTKDYREIDLFERALSNLSKIKLLINPSYLQVSLLCIERTYSLSSPLINPFSNLSHNPVTLSGVKSSDTSVINRCKEILIKHSRVDLKLFPYLNTIFARQANSASITDREVAVRDALHSQQLFNPKWFVLKKYSREDVIHLVSKSLEKCCQQHSEIDKDILETFFAWDGLSFDFRQDINSYLVEKFSRNIYI